MATSVESTYKFIPVEIWEHILESYNIYDLILLRSVSKYLNYVCKCVIRSEDEELFDQAECLEYYAKYGFSSCLVWAHKIGYRLNPNICATASASNHFDTLKILRTNGCPWDSDVCDYAAANGNLEMLKWARENGCAWTSDTPLAAARAGQLECLKYILDNKCKWKKADSVFTRLDLIQFLIENQKTFDVEDTYLRAAKEGKMDIIKFMTKNGCPTPSTLLLWAADFGSVELMEEIRTLPNLTPQSLFFGRVNSIPMMKYLIDELRIEPSVYVAVNSGSMEVLKYLHEERQVPLTHAFLTQAVEIGQLDVVQYIMERIAVTSDETLCYRAVGKGNVDLLKYLHQRGFPLVHGPQTNIYIAAISAKSLACMKYAAENGCPLPVTSHMVSRAAVENNALDCLKFAREIGCEWNSSDSTIGLCYIAMLRGHYEIFKYLHKNGCLLHEDFCVHAARSGRLAFMKYARKFVRWDEKVCVAAAGNLLSTCLHYAHSTGLKLTPDVIREAVTCSSTECLKYAVENGCEWPADIWSLVEDCESIDVSIYVTAHCPIRKKNTKRTPKKKSINDYVS